ncbi:MAG: outer membrane beta-barrel protein [Bacteroidetes bacterium]|nr:outer membrane beta-barrel protein [Bacteroidota bacterium]MDA1335987.1 outer membrane beta-barrel protein [Bacteroidota bacterium]
MKYSISILIILFGMTLNFAVASVESVSYCDTTATTESKEKSVGNWRGFSGSVVSMAQFQGNLDDYNANWGARPGLGLITDDVSQSWRLEFNPLEKRQRILGEFLGITTGLGVDWWRVGIDPEHRLDYDEVNQIVVAEILNPDSVNVTKNQIDAIYLRVPFLASLHTYRAGKSGFHIEAGLVAGYLLHSNYQYERQSGFTTLTTSEEFVINPLQLNGRASIGIGKISLLGEASLLPFFDENPQDSPNMHSFSIGVQFRFSD